MPVPIDSATVNDSTVQDKQDQNSMNGNRMMNHGMMGNDMMNNGMMGRVSNSGSSSANTGNSSNEGWKAPASAAKLTNPLKGIISAAEAGKNIYHDQCQTCHGKTGSGNGPTGVMLKPKPSNLISTKIRIQSDGELFWKISNGNLPMPPFKNILSIKQRWEVIDYIRKLKEKQN